MRQLLSPRLWWYGGAVLYAALVGILVARTILFIHVEYLLRQTPLKIEGVVTPLQRKELEQLARVFFAEPATPPAPPAELAPSPSPTASPSP